MIWQGLIGQPLHMDCFDLLAQLPDGCVNLLFLDPPYNIGVFCKMPPDEYLAWCERWIAEGSRVLAANGAFWVCHKDPVVLGKLSEMIEAHGRKRINWVTWDKYNGNPAQQACGGPMVGMTQVESLRSFQVMAEYLIYHADEGDWTAQCDRERGFIFEPLRAYLESERQRAGVHKEDINEWLGFRRQGGMAGRHYFSRSQWQLPTKEHYQAMRECLNSSDHNGEYLRREYEDLRREYEDLRYTFNNPGKVSSVWQIPPAPKATWLDRTLTVKYNTRKLIPGRAKCQGVNIEVAQLLERVISEYIKEMGGEKWNIVGYGENIMAQCQEDFLSIILTVINKIIELKILNSSMRSLTRDFIQDVNLEMENGGNPVENAKSSRKFQPITTKGKTASCQDVKRVALEMLLHIRKKSNWKRRLLKHPTPKPEALLERVIETTSDPGDLVLDFFAGSFTTAVCAERLGRRWICGDNDERWVELGQERIAQPEQIAMEIG